MLRLNVLHNAKWRKNLPDAAAKRGLPLNLARKQIVIAKRQGGCPMARGPAAPSIAVRKRTGRSRLKGLRLAEQGAHEHHGFARQQGFCTVGTRLGQHRAIDHAMKASPGKIPEILTTEKTPDTTDASIFSQSTTAVSHRRFSQRQRHEFALISFAHSRVRTALAIRLSGRRYT